MKQLKKITLLLLAMCLLACFFVGCAKGETLMELEGTKMTVNIFSLYLSRMKGTLCATIGSQAKEDIFWDTLLYNDGTTYNDYYTQNVLKQAKTYLAALHLFEELDLKLPDSYEDEIDAEMESLLSSSPFNGSKTQLNEELAKYGVNYNILKEAYLIEAKIAYLKEHLYGTNGSKVGSTMIEEYYQKNYAHFKHVFLYTHEKAYVTDSNGDTIYYLDGKRIAYDQSATPKTNTSGDVVKDKNGDPIYVHEDGRIAYDKQNGTRQPIYEEDGSTQKTIQYSAAKKAEIRALADTILLRAEETPISSRAIVFDQLISEFNQDASLDANYYPNGYYLTKDSAYISADVVDAVFDMEVGEVRRVIDDEYGVWVVMRYETETGAWADEKHKDFFRHPATGNYLFMSELTDQLYAEYLAPYAQKVLVDEERLAGVDMKSVEPNYYY